MHNSFDSYPYERNPSYNYKYSNPEMMNNMNNNYVHSDFDEAFIPNEQLVEKQSYINKGKILHNNINDNTFVEGVVDYQINIDSDDRNVEIFPNPFHYVVSFKATGKFNYNKFKTENNEDAEFPETPGPVIIRNFKNVKYIGIDQVTLPRYLCSKFYLFHDIMVEDDKIIMNDVRTSKYCNTINQNGLCSCKVEKCQNGFCDCNCEICKSDNKCNLCFVNKNIDCSCKNNYKCHICNDFSCYCNIVDNNKYLILKIPEVKNSRILGTNTNMGNATFFLYMDKTLGPRHNVWVTKRINIIAYNSLQNLDRLTILLCNSKGELLTTYIILHYNVRINDICHEFVLYFGKTKPKNEYNNNKIYFPLLDILNIKKWYNVVFNRVVAHITDDKIKEQVVKNYSIFLEKIKSADIDSILKYEKTNNVLMTIGVVQNSMSTIAKHN